MEKYFKRQSKFELSSSTTQSESLKKSHTKCNLPDLSASQNESLKKNCAECNLHDLPVDPGLRPCILDYDPNIRDQVRRAYLLKGLCQPCYHNFSKRQFGQSFRRFNPSWFDKFGGWLEYSISKDVAYCLCCYLSRPEIGDQAGGDSFVSEGFTNWKKKERLQTHMGGVNSTHYQAWKKCQDLLNKKHIETIISKLSDDAKRDYRVRLTATVDCIRFLLWQELLFRGRDEYEHSTNQGNFLELLKFLTEQNENVNCVALKNAPENLKLTSPDIQKDIVNAATIETTNAILAELGDGLFSILVDESRDVSIKEQMEVALRYVNKERCVVERFLGIKYVTSTAALSLKKAVEDLFSTHNLSISRVRGQRYDGASNMQGEFNGLKTLILQENGFAYYAHCFAHQLQLALVAVAKNHIHMADLFLVVLNIVNVVGASCKRQYLFREKQASKVVETLHNDEITSGHGLNQERTLIRASDTRWGSHYGTLISLIGMFSIVIDVLDVIVEDGTISEQRAEAFRLLDSMQSFEFVFSLHLMRAILRITNDLLQALQRRDQDIVNALELVQISKQRLQMLRDNGWSSLVDEISSFGGKHQIDVPNMDETYVIRGRSRRRAQEMTNSHHYRIKLFYTVIDMQIQELDNRFNEVNTELLFCVACLNPSDSFVTFDKERLARFAELYPKTFLILRDYQFLTNLRILSWMYVLHLSFWI